MAKRPLTLALMLVSATVFAQAATAAERIYCAASDDIADMSIEIGFSKKDPERLQHFRGVAGLKGKSVDPGLARFEVSSDMIRQYWIDDTDLRFSLRNTLPNRRPAIGLSLIVLTERKSLASLRFEGTYTMKLVRYTEAGMANGETIVENTAPIFCSIKR